MRTCIYYNSVPVRVLYIVLEHVPFSKARADLPILSFIVLTKLYVFEDSLLTLLVLNVS